MSEKGGVRSFWQKLEPVWVIGFYFCWFKSSIVHPWICERKHWLIQGAQLLLTAVMVHGHGCYLYLSAREGMSAGSNWHWECVASSYFRNNIFCAALRSIWFKMLSAFITKPIHHISGYASKVMLSLEKVWKQCKAFNKPFAEESLGFGLVLHVVWWFPLFTCHDGSILRLSFTFPGGFFPFEGYPSHSCMFCSS